MIDSLLALFRSPDSSSETSSYVGEDIPFSKRLQKLFFTKNRQFEFLDNYLALKGDGKEQMPDKNVLSGIREVYTETVSENCFEVYMCDFIEGVLRDGGNMAEALVPFFDSKIIMAFRATYAVGKTSYGITQVIKNIKGQTELRKGFVKNLRTGLMFFVAGVVGVIVISSQFLPMLLGMVDESNVDSLTLFYKDLGGFINNSLLNIALGIIVLTIIYLISLPIWTGPSRSVADKFFLYSIYQSFASNQFFNMLTLLKTGGLSLRQSLEVINDDSTPYMQSHIERMLDMTRTGSTDLEQLNTGLLPPRLQVRLKIAGMRGGTMDSVFELISASASKDVTKKLNVIAGGLQLWLMISGISMLAVSVMVILNILLGVAMGT